MVPPVKTGAASVAQLVEQLICNQPVVGSNPSAGSCFTDEPLPTDPSSKGNHSQNEQHRNDQKGGFARVVKGGGL